MESINYKRLFEIKDKCIVFTNDESELVVQIVNNRYLFIEMESECVHIDRIYSSEQEMIGDLNRYNLSIDNSNYFAKKAEIVLNEILTR